jgi:hypothetical protein
MGKQDHFERREKHEESSIDSQYTEDLSAPTTVDHDEMFRFIHFLREHIIWEVSGTACPYNLFTIASANV